MLLIAQLMSNLYCQKDNLHVFEKAVTQNIHIIFISTYFTVKNIPCRKTKENEENKETNNRTGLLKACSNKRGKGT